MYKNESIINHKIESTKNKKITLEDIFKVLSQHNLIKSYSKNLDMSMIGVNYVSYNSKDIRPSTLFICKGVTFKEQYLKDAIELGVSSYISETIYEEVNDKVAYIQVSDVRKAMSLIAILYYNYPHKSLNIVGITGTKGKTTTTYFMKNILDEYLNAPSAILSTVEIFTGTSSEEAHLTTPESLDLQRHFANALENGIKHLTMEVSSQAYKSNRVFGMDFDIGVFLNIDEDHIGPLEHEDFEDYISCKLEFIKNCRVAVIYGQTREFNRVMETAKKYCEKVITYGIENTEDYFVTNIRKEGIYTLFEVNGDNYRKTFATQMRGNFNVENALASITVAKMLEIDDDAIYRGIEKTQVKGRMNVIESEDVTVIVDYAHNHLSFSRLYESIKLDYPGRRVVTVVGASGGKALGRRRDVGKLSGENSHYVYLTAEDPQFEDVKDICRDIAKYLKPYKVPYEIIEDRTKAVEKAILKAKAGDVVLLAAKGEELYQKVKGEYKYYESDIAIAKRCLNKTGTK
jgi:UDP-N-acetylmuramyl-tripeptide synthetase